MRAFGDRSATDLTFGGRLFGVRGCIASEHHLSAQAGMDMFREGGNAFDAAAAAVLVESVVNVHMFSLGGECPMLILPASSGRVEAVNGNTAAPENATLDAYLRRGLDIIPPRGVLSAGVPAVIGAVFGMLERYGTLPVDVVVEPARQLASEGFPVHEGLVGMPAYGIGPLRDTLLSEWPGSASMYLADGCVPEPGHVLRNEPLGDLLSSLARIASGGPTRDAGVRAAREWFYKGDPARELSEFSRQHEGFLQRSDFEVYETRFEPPASTRFHGAEVYKCGPWSQGPVNLEILNLLAGYDLRSMGHNSADYLHLWVEAAKLAFADREQFFADPSMVPVPLDGLLSREYTECRRALINMERADCGFRPGDPARRQALLPADEVFRWESWGFGTVHVAAADAEGNLVSCSPSGGWLAGNDTVPALGFPLGTRLQTFYLEPGHPNAPASFKRPRTSLSPGLAVVKGATPEVSRAIAFGTMGGDQQDQWTNQFLLNHLVFGMGVQEAIEAPKVSSDHFPGIFHPHSAFPCKVCAEDRIPAEVLKELADRGHDVATLSGWSAGFLCAAVRYDNGLLEAGADPRGNKARVFPATAMAR